MIPGSSAACSRRHFLASQAMSIGGVALAWLLNEEGVFAAGDKPDLVQPTYDLLPKPPARPPQATAMISFLMQGGPSHIDLFEPKPELTKRHGQSFTGEIQLDNAAEATSKLYASPWKFEKHGECGTELSELLPHLAKVVDDICLIR